MHAQFLFKERYRYVFSYKSTIPCLMFKCSVFSSALLFTANSVHHGRIRPSLLVFRQKKGLSYSLLNCFRGRTFIIVVALYINLVISVINIV